jgi:hypothetical protein
VTATANGGDARTASVSVASLSVSVSQAAEPPPPQQVTLTGIASSVSGRCPTLTFVVGSTNVTTFAETVFAAGPCRNLQDGTSVRVNGTRSPGGGVDATRVTFLRDD